MSGLEALQSVQFATAGDRRLAVIGAEDWGALVEWLETPVDIEIAREAAEQLRMAGRDRERAGWLRWDGVNGQIE